ncbi:hypothetical protein F5X68DRAFT_263664 [Plectosphaerella plurivora]|uniref:Uncharacterized protein n=1 Tax=Plectosphaerella plurivora TaxID=936078 RepID=A0A9P8V7T1_9PEZI|nr:hypothetical protein F5X68DRAFT_263664 [Plectosphaerella plurivora]
MEAIDIYTPDPALIPRASDASKRLFWTLNGPLESSIQVSPSPYYEPEAVMEAYCRPATDDGPASWHPVSEENLFTMAHQTVKVRIENFAGYEQLWSDLNWEDSGAKWAALARDDPDFDPYDHDPDLGIPICPINVDDHILTVTTTEDYLTIHEYVSAVHPWLMSIREIIVEALWYTNGRGTSWTSESKLVVARGAGSIHVGGEKDWRRSHRKPYVPFIGPMQPRPPVEERMMAMARERIRVLEEAKARERETQGADTEAPGLE